MLVGDWVLRDVDAFVGRGEPERGGALLGPRGRALVSRFVADADAAAGRTVWRPSRALDRAVKDAERGEGLELKGLVHSHPPGLDRPSAQDADEVAVGLGLNGHLACYLAPIVTAGAAERLEPHELPLPSGKISFFAGWRTRRGGAELRPARLRALPLLADLERAARELGAPPPEMFMATLEGDTVSAGRLRLDGGLELVLLAPDPYPSAPPLALVTSAGAATRQLHLEWSLEVPAGERLAAVLRRHLRPPGPYALAFGPAGGAALTRDAGRARLAGWTARFTGGDPDRQAAAAREGLFARTAGLLSTALAERTALLAGCGSVGSYLAELLVRSGVGGVALLDPEPVEPPNLSRTVYELADVGRPKVEALARRLLAIQPALRIAADARAVEDLAPAELDGLVRGADLVIAATDDPAAQRALNRFAFARGRPALFVGLYAGARGGEVVLSFPGRSACYLCATRARHEVERAAGRVAGETDYGTARLHGEVALAADIQHVASAAAKLGLSLLARDDAGATLGAFAEEPLAAGTPYLTLSTVPRYWFYPRVFGDTPGQGAYQGVWLGVSPSVECPVCGAPANRVDPLEVPLRAPAREALAAAAQSGLSAAPSDAAAR